MDAPAPPSPKAGPSLGLAIGLMVAGTLLGIAAVVLVTLPLLRLVKDAPSVTTPGSAALHLDKGLYKVFERTGNLRQSGPLSGTPRGPTTLRATDVAVSRAGGGDIPASGTGPNETINRNGGTYSSALSFRVSTPGDYTVRIVGGPGEVIISRSLADAVRGRVGWVASIPIGALMFLIGLVALVVGLTRRSRTRRTGHPPAGYPPPPWPPQRTPQV